MDVGLVKEGLEGFNPDAYEVSVSLSPLLHLRRGNQRERKDNELIFARFVWGLAC